LSGVPNPQPFAATCRKTRNGFAGVRQARAAGVAV